MYGYINIVVYKTEFWERCVPPLGIGEVHTSPKKTPTFPYNFSKIWPWLYVNSVFACMPLDFLSLLQMVIVAMHVSLVLGNVIRIEIIVFRNFMTLVKHDQILSLFNQAYYYTNYCVFKV